MGYAEHCVRALYYGFGDDDVFFRFDPATTLHPQATANLILSILGEKQLSLTIPLNRGPLAESGADLEWVFGDVLEIRVRRERLGLPRGGECQFWIEVTDESMTLEKLPPAGAFHFVIPTQEAVAANWMV
jgi:hypothetical protein